LTRGIAAVVLQAVNIFIFQGGGGDQAGWFECSTDEGASWQGWEACVSGGSRPHDETHHQLFVQEQGGSELIANSLL